jgi:hypothetical protein
MSHETISYTRTELLSYLPTGWSPASNGEWDPALKVWRVLVRDGAEVEWPLEVSAQQAFEAGREGALRHAVDRLYREALG